MILRLLFSLICAAIPIMGAWAIGHYLCHINNLFGAWGVGLLVEFCALIALAFLAMIWEGIKPHFHDLIEWIKTGE